MQTNIVKIWSQLQSRDIDILKYIHKLYFHDTFYHARCKLISLKRKNAAPFNVFAITGGESVHFSLVCGLTERTFQNAHCSQMFTVVFRVFHQFKIDCIFRFVK